MKKLIKLLALLLVFGLLLGGYFVYNSYMAKKEAGENSPALIKLLK